MSAFYFGPRGQQLFGYMHAPAGPSAGAVLLCAPWASEYQYAHRALHFLARKLAERGFFVLRFDYSGTGDSWGDAQIADLTAWTSDVRHAVDELRAASGAERFDLVGLRLGAFVAAQAGLHISGVRRLVLWDPVIDGDQWLTEHGVTGGSTRDIVEVAGTIASPQFVEQLRSVTAETFVLPPAEGTMLLLTQREHWGLEALPAWAGARHELMDQPAPWVEDESIWTGQVPVEAVTRIAQWLN